MHKWTSHYNIRYTAHIHIIIHGAHNTFLHITFTRKIYTSCSTYLLSSLAGWLLLTLDVRYKPGCQTAFKLAGRQDARLPATRKPDNQTARLLSRQPSRLPGYMVTMPPGDKTIMPLGFRATRPSCYNYSIRPLGHLAARPSGDKDIRETSLLGSLHNLARK